MSRLVPRIVSSLTMIIKDGQILLGFKKRGYAFGKWCGFGGKLEDNETAINAAIREVREECGLDILEKHMTKVGALEFEFIGKPEIMHVHVFQCSVFSGELSETDEMIPHWFPVEDIPYSQMWPDEKYWIPMILSQEKFHGYFLYDNDERIIDKRIKVMDHTLM